MESQEKLLYIVSCLETPDSKVRKYTKELLKDLEELEQYKNIEIKLGKLLKALKNGIYTEHKYVQQCYICFIDDEWTIVDLKNDEWWLLKDYGKTWALTEEELL